MMPVPHALRAGFTIEDVFNLTKMEHWSLMTPFLYAPHATGQAATEVMTEDKQGQGQGHVWQGNKTAASFAHPSAQHSAKIFSELIDFDG